ncbi:MAG: divergent polysaccharide deacetylase family protein [Firmicutes bacterium]|nr:divergent polysaccharide deacetylase family protein [Bacillota bacterium]NLL89250.1 divergent polysaccharide deacetylase family protein [Bacillota bacterium]HKM16659.1 divergent polysaccharide deacetylase family protein [Limnochordia bacterium]
MAAAHPQAVVAESEEVSLMQQKPLVRQYQLRIALILACCCLSITLVWFSLHKLAAGVDSPEKTDVGQPEVGQEGEDPFLAFVDKLSFVGEHLDQQGYLLLESLTDSTKNLAKHLIVPTSPDLEFTELITGIAAELEFRYGWPVRIEYLADEISACMVLRVHDLPGCEAGVQTADAKPAIDQLDENNSLQLWIKQLSPADQRGGLRPKLALVIDDWGYSSSYTESFLQYPFPLTVAIIPHLAESSRLAQLAFASGHEVILHQPMEALNAYVELGEGGILASMGADEIRELLEANIDHLPMIAGVNNHMGSKVTTDPEVMAIILEMLKSKGLYFLDSYTTPLSTAGTVASKVGIPYAVNSLFIDNVNEVEAVKTQLRRIIQQAGRTGSAVAIGHVRSATVAAVWEMIPEIVAAGIDLVPVSQVLIYPEPQAEPAEELAEEPIEEPAEELAEEPSEAAADELATMETRAELEPDAPASPGGSVQEEPDPAGDDRYVNGVPNEQEYEQENERQGEQLDDSPEIGDDAADY